MPASSYYYATHARTAHTQTRSLKYNKTTHYDSLIDTAKEFDISPVTELSENIGDWSEVTTSTTARIFTSKFLRAARRRT